ncbi:hypothetical protein [Candidatus Lariskella endosymbiont of Hedychridium roseum]|uniref:hypothetical protein n=1 Tax=Candidatus Lariskella endosymbiont of Hedychridium roseum TaxID=3077949 RepID=UPI0030D444CD
MSYRAFRAICKDHNVQQRFFAALEKEKGISLTEENLLEIDKALKEFYSRNSTSFFQGLAAQMFYF